jgi:NtrC-family two-component system response regulator AlgB
VHLGLAAVVPMTPAETANRSLRVMVVDDDRYIRETLAVCVEDLGCEATCVACADEALAVLRRRPHDLAFLDLRLEEASGLDLLPRLVAACPELAVVVITAYATVETAVEAIRRGATDYLPKPFSPAEIRLRIEQVAARRRLARRVSDLEQQLRESVPEVELASTAPRMVAVLEVIERAALSDVPVLLRGESGTGKSLLARAVHERSPRASAPFVVVACPTLSEELLTSELFGHARGAFTGAIRDHPGRVETAEGGTLFLDEIGDLSPVLQAKLLRFVQEKRFERIGENVTRAADVRVVAATNRDIDQDVRSGRFREDLLYRLNVVEVTVPPLRERPGDLLRLARHFLEFFSRAARRPTPTLSSAAERVLTAHAWPGNVRELRNAIERAVILWPAQTLEPEAFSERVAASSEAAPRVGGPYTLEEIEREHVLQVMASRVTLDEVARVLGIEPSTLWRKRKKFGI